MPNVRLALEIAAMSKGEDGTHHKTYCIDQMVRALTDCPIMSEGAFDCYGKPHMGGVQGESEEYKEWVATARAGEDGPETYEWDVGIPP